MSSRFRWERKGGQHIMHWQGGGRWTVMKSGTTYTIVGEGPGPRLRTVVTGVAKLNAAKRICERLHRAFIGA